MQSDAHDEDKFFEAFGALDFAVHQAKTAAFEVREHAFNPPMHAVMSRGKADASSIRFALRTSSISVDKRHKPSRRDL